MKIHDDANDTVDALVQAEAAIGRARDLIAEAMENHIYDADNGEKPEPDCGYQAFIDGVPDILTGLRAAIAREQAAPVMLTALQFALGVLNWYEESPREMAAQAPDAIEFIKQAIALAGGSAGAQQAAPPLYVECGSCGHFHRAEFGGDCRNDAERFTADELDAKHGENGWIYESEEEQLDAEYAAQAESLGFAPTQSVDANGNEIIVWAQDGEPDGLQYKTAREAVESAKDTTIEPACPVCGTDEKYQASCKKCFPDEQPATPAPYNGMSQQWFLVIGRVAFDDEDSVMAFQCANQDEAMEAFEADIKEARELGDDAEFFLNQVIACGYQKPEITPL